MHTLTLSFTSLADLSAAVSKLNGGALAGTLPAPADLAPAAAKSKAAPKAAAPAASAEPAQSPAQAPAADVKPSAAAEVKVDYPTLQAAVFALVGKVKAKALDPAVHVLGIAKEFGYANFAAMKEAGPEGAKHFAAALEKVKAKTAEVDAIELEVA